MREDAGPVTHRHGVTTIGRPGIAANREFVELVDSQLDRNAAKETTRGAVLVVLSLGVLHFCSAQGPWPSLMLGERERVARGKQLPQHVAILLDDVEDQPIGIAHKGVSGFG